MTRENDKLYEAAITHWGHEMQLDMAIEEMAELTKAICKVKRGKNIDTLEAVTEEIADVEIMIEQLKVIFACHERAADWKAAKLDRLQNILGQVMDQIAGPGQ